MIDYSKFVFYFAFHVGFTLWPKIFFPAFTNALHACKKVTAVGIVLDFIAGLLLYLYFEASHAPASDPNIASCC